MSFDPEKFGQAMGEAIRKAVEPLQAEIASLKSQLATIPAPAVGKDGTPGRDGKDCDMEAVKALVAEAVNALPVPADGKDGAPGADGSSVTLDDLRPLMMEAVKDIRAEAVQSIEAAVKAIPAPKDGRDGRDGIDGKDGAKGEPGKDGADGLGQAGAMIDRDGALQVTLTNGEVKNLGLVVGKNGKDGTNGTNGTDGIGLDSFELEYLQDSHEICLTATAGGRTKELRYPAGGIRPKGYWREGTRAKAGDAWVNDGSLWIAVKDCESKPGLNDDGWIIAARKGRDGERGRDAKAVDTSPIKLGN